MNETRALWPLSVVLAAAACGGEPRQPVMVTERDSAGITIVENRVDTAAIRAGWSIGPEPLLVIGGADADESQQLFQVSGARRLPDGRIAVANGGSSDIRVFGPDGALLAVHGRKGQGPGEYEQPQLAGVYGGDSLLVFDPHLRRVTLLRADSGTVRSWLVGAEGGGFPLARGALADGSLLLGGGMYFSSEEGFPNGLVRPPSRYVVVGTDGAVVGDLGNIPAAEMLAKATATSFTASGIPFGKITATAAASNRVWLGTGESWEMRGYERDARLSRISRIDRELQRVTQSMIDAFIEERAAEANDENHARSIRASMAEAPAPSVVPPWELFETDALDHLWVGEFLLPGETARTWTILDPGGRVAGRLTLPPRTLPLHSGPDWLLGLTRDELEVESLTLWRLQRPAR